MIVLSIVLAVAVAAPAKEEVQKKIIEILSSNFDSNPDGSYAFRWEQSSTSKVVNWTKQFESSWNSFEGADGSARQEKGIVINQGTDQEAIAVEGIYRYLDADNNPVEVAYTANEKGFVPEGGNIHPAVQKGARLASESVDETETAQLKKHWIKKWIQFHRENPKEKSFFLFRKCAEK